MKIKLNLEYLKTHYYAVKVTDDDMVVMSEECPLCNSPTCSLSVIKNRSGDDLLIKSICPSCTYIYFSKYPSNKWIANFYSNVWDAARLKAKKQNIDSAYKESFSLFEKYINDKTLTIFDLGSGYGEFLLGCRKRGFENLFGIENSIKRMKYCNDELDLNISHCTAEEIDGNKGVLSDGPYDVIHSNAVFEHLYDINKSMQNVKKILKNDGLLILIVPNAINEHFLYIAQALPHIRNFTEFSMQILLQKHGFDVMEMSVDEGNIKVIAKNNVNINFDLPKLKESEWKVMQEKFQQKILSDFDFSGNDKTKFRFWSFGDSSKLETKYTLTWGELLSWKLKKYFVGINRKEYPIGGIDLDYMSALNLKNVGMKISRVLQNYNKIEISGCFEISIDQDDLVLRKKPLLELTYPSEEGVVLVK